MSFLISGLRRSAIAARTFSSSMVTVRNNSSSNNNSNSAIVELLKNSARDARGSSAPIRTPLNMADSLSQLNSSTAARQSSLFGNFRNSKGSSRNQQHQQHQDTEFKVAGYTKDRIPRTGVKAGRSVPVTGALDLNRALRNLNSMNNTNRVRQTAMAQTKYEKPGKRKQRLRIQRSKRRFDMGIRRLFEMVADARRKGY
ncbi:hypothetical protein DV451_002444 [Geotrichum candidum]|uniref:Uncharacterized protein n=1 Tax=Geotrichum candidum TaxID=1173061 RepID=A0A9P5G5S1_GEOCN|nr:hypothetical protein DV451_002444 [Geotrichum candidum]KAF5111551.1 hypothetical protein DV453_000196 [Geotrichum candidum]